MRTPLLTIRVPLSHVTLQRRIADRRERACAALQHLARVVAHVFQDPPLGVAPVVADRARELVPLGGLVGAGLGGGRRGEW